MEQWPYNGKSMWASLQPGQRFALFVGIPTLYAMQQSLIWLLKEYIESAHVRALILYFAFIALPFLYVRGVGIFIAAVYQVLFVPRK